jgi:hypothetical protein
MLFAVSFSLTLVTWSPEPNMFFDDVIPTLLAVV